MSCSTTLKSGCDMPPDTKGVSTDKILFTIPEALAKGTMMTKVSERKTQRRVIVKLDPDEGQIRYDSKKFGCIAIETIQEIRSGSDARSFRAQLGFPESAESRWTTVIYVMEGKHYKRLHMLADSVDIFNMWNASLRKLFAIRQGLVMCAGNAQLRDAIWERQYWKEADMRQDRKLTLQEVELLCCKLNVNLLPIEIRELFEAADVEKRQYLDSTGFHTFVKLLKQRPDIEAIYAQLCHRQTSGKLDLVNFTKFMRDVQKTDATDDTIRGIFSKYSSVTPESDTHSDLTSAPGSCDPPGVDSSAAISQDAFAMFLSSDENSVVPEKERHIWQDMTRPISEYYISSSHNTYLVGNQLTSVSTVEGYIRALLHSCRTVEVDVYDGYPEPLVFHGKTLTPSIPLREICVAIAKYAFVTSPYPVIISAEVHCSLPQQDKIAQILTEVFGDSLVQASEVMEKISVLPSPESLKGRILLKAKNLYMESLPTLRQNKVDLSLDNFEAEIASLSSSDSETENTAKNIVKEGINSIKEKWHYLRRQQPAKPLKMPMSLSLARLIVYTVGVKFRGFNAGISYAPEHVFSISEKNLNRLLRVRPRGRPSAPEVAPAAVPDAAGSGVDGNLPMQLIGHTRGHVIRTYPRGRRIMSENYRPHRFWAVGAQAVALNWQTFDLGYAMNMAMFQRNGRTGYILKPQALRFGGEEQLSVLSKQVLDVSIISGQQLPCGDGANGDQIPVVDAFVQVSVHTPEWHTFIPASLDRSLSMEELSTLSSSPARPGTQNSVSERSTPLHIPERPITPTPPIHLPGLHRHGNPEHEGYRVTQKTRVVKRNGFNPVWQETMSLPFECLGGKDMRDLIFVQFSVKQEGKEDKYIAGYCTPLSCLQLGYRYLPLHDAQGNRYLFSTLFVWIEIREVA